MEKKEKPEDQPADTNQQSPGKDIFITQSQNKNMEPHIHPHIHHEKKWKDYLFEFLMLFLAVSAGFFVENMRENYAERHHAGAFAKSLYADLQYDTSKLNWTISQRKINVSNNGSLIAELNKSTDEQNDTMIQRLTVSLLNNWYFENYSGTYEQVKNSGALRYFPDSISNALTYYEQSVKQNSLAQNMEEDFFSTTLQPFVYANINFKSLQLQTGANNDNRTFIKSDPFFKERLYGYATYCLDRNLFLSEELERLRGQAITIMRLLNEKYRL